MICKKCKYSDPKTKIMFGSPLCKICVTFAPSTPKEFQEYISEKIDWKTLETFRKYNQTRETKQKIGMDKKAKIGKLQSRPPLGYNVENGKLILNQEQSKVHTIFKAFLSENISLNKLAKRYSLSVNGIKKILTNRTYLGEIKFDGKIYHGVHKPIINPEIFYAVQRKLKNILKSK